MPFENAQAPLAGVGVIVTRPVRQASTVAQRLATLGARAIVWPAIVILPPADTGPLDRAHRQLGDYHLAVFESPNAVEYGAPDAALWPASLPIYAPGLGTAEAVAAVGLPAAHVPATTFDSDGLIALAALRDVAGKRVVIFRGDDGRAQLGDALRARGAIVEYIPCYRRAAPRSGTEGLLRVLKAREAQALSLTSVEGLTNLLAVLDRSAFPALAALKTFAAHPRIAAAACSAGLDAMVTPPGDAGLIAALLEWFARQRQRP